MQVVTYQDIVINAKSIPSNLGLKILHQKIGPLMRLGVSHPSDHIFRQRQAPLKRLRVRDKPFSKISQERTLCTSLRRSLQAKLALGSPQCKAPTRILRDETVHLGTSRWCMSSCTFSVVLLRQGLTDRFLFILTRCTDTGVIVTHALSFYWPLAPLYC